MKIGFKEITAIAGAFMSKDQDKIMNAILPLITNETIHFTGLRVVDGYRKKEAIQKAKNGNSIALVMIPNDNSTDLIFTAYEWDKTAKTFGAVIGSVCLSELNEDQVKTLLNKELVTDGDI